MSHAMPLPDDRARRARNVKTALVLVLVASAFLIVYVIRRSLG